MLSTDSKKVIYEKTLKHTQVNNIISDSPPVCQKKNLSFQNAITSLIDQIMTTLSSKRVGLTFFIDFKKAIGLIEHVILPRILYGFQGNIYHWSKSYLIDRSGYIKLVEDDFSAQNESLHR